MGTLWIVIVSGLAGAVFSLIGRAAFGNWRVGNWIALPNAVLITVGFWRLQEWPPGDIYGWGTMILPAVIAGVFVPPLLRAGWKVRLVLGPVIVAQLIFGVVAMQSYIDTMDSVGYGVSYWYGHLWHGVDPVYVQTKITESFWQEVIATALYLSIVSLIMVAPLSLLAWWQGRQSTKPAQASVYSLSSSSSSNSIPL